MLNRIFLGTSAAMSLLLAVTAIPASAQSFPGEPQRMTNSPETYVQATLGELDVRSRAEYSLNSPVAPPTNEVRTFGFVMQMATDEGFFQYGFEAGGQVGLDRHHDFFAYFNGDQSRVEIESRLWTTDLSFGGFLSYRLTDWLRLYASAGGIGYWARADDSNHSSTSTGGGLEVDLRGSADDVGLGGYQRAGVEFTLGRKVNLGLSVRKTNMKLDFGEYGELRLDEPGVQLTIGYHF